MFESMAVHLVEVMNYPSVTFTYQHFNTTSAFALAKSTEASSISTRQFFSRFWFTDLSCLDLISSLSCHVILRKTI